MSSAHPFVDWNAVVAHLHAHHELDDADDESATLTLATQKGRTQQVRVHIGADARDTQWIELQTGVCGLQQLAPETALSDNGAMPFGAYSLLNDSYDLGYRYPLRWLTPARLDALLQRLARDGDAQEEHLTGADEF